MTSTATAADEFKSNFYEAAKDLMAQDPDTPYVHVCYGTPATFEPEDIISFTSVSSDQTDGPISTNRAREETLTLEVVISCWRGGGQDMELVCARRAYQLLRMLETYARVTDTTVGGSVRHCFLVQHQSSGTTDPQLLEQGRVIDITARFMAKARISN